MERKLNQQANQPEKPEISADTLTNLDTDTLLNLYGVASSPCSHLTKYENLLKGAIAERRSKQPFTPEQQRRLINIYSETGWDGGFDF